METRDYSNHPTYTETFSYYTGAGRAAWLAILGNTDAVKKHYQEVLQKVDSPQNWPNAYNTQSHQAYIQALSNAINALQRRQNGNK